MANIDPNALATARKQANLSLTDLQNRAGIDRTTIHRFESGKSRSARASTLRKLADALRVTPEALAGERPMPERENKSSTFAHESQLNVRVSTAARNALSLMSVRYGVQPVRIIELAAFLFHAAAQASLKRRRERLDSLIEKQSGIEGMRESFHHLHHSVVGHWTAEDTIAEEAHSIEKQDIFGKQITSGEYEGLRDDYWEDEDNPLVTFFKEVAAATGEDTSFDAWFPSSSPTYEVGRADAKAIVGEDDDALHEILTGMTPLHEMPKDLQGNGSPEERAKWVRERAAATRANRALPDLDDLIEMAFKKRKLGDES